MGERRVGEAEEDGEERGKGDKCGIARYLAACIRTHRHVPVCSARKTSVHACAEGGVALFAVLAAPVGNVKGEDNAVALLEEGHAWTRFGHNTHVLMA